MKAGGILLVLLVWASTHVPAFGQPKLGKIDVSLMLESLPEALAVREKFHETRDAAHHALEMQLGGLLVAAYPEVPTSSETKREAFGTFFPKFKAEAKQQSKELQSWLMEKEAAMLQPLMEKVDSAIESVRIELQLDTILRTEGCPFDLWAEDKFLQLSNNNYQVWSFRGWGWPNYNIAVPEKEHCLRLGSVLATGPDVLDIAPMVLEKLLKP